MSSRQDHIDFERNYCVHYNPQPGSAGVKCDAGEDLRARQKASPQVEGSIRSAPCIAGHNLADPTAACPHWTRRSIEHAEARADAMERAIERMRVVTRAVASWRTWSWTNRVAKKEVIECPVCKGRLHLSQAAVNGHVRGRCETEDCVNWME